MVKESPILKIKDCFKYEKEMNLSKDFKGVMNNNAKVDYEDFSKLVDYFEKSLNDMKNLLTIHRNLLSEILDYINNPTDVEVIDEKTKEKKNVQESKKIKIKSPDFKNEKEIMEEIDG